MPKPIVASYCTTFLKPEMLHIYRQITGLRRYGTFVVAKERIQTERFPFADIELVPRKPRKNFARRFWLKHVRKLPALYYRGEFQGMMKIFRRRDADLMHIYFGHTGVHLLPFIAGWEKPCIVSFHGMDVQTRAAKPEYEAQLRELLRVVPLVLARSISLRERLIALGCPPEKIRLNRTGIPLGQFPFQNRTAPVDGAWRFVQACRLIPKKGLKTALHAFALFNKRLPNSKFVIAGEGPMQKEIEQLANELEIGKSIELRGFLDQPALCKLYGESHIFLHPSEMTADQNQEGVPNSMLEAMSTGLPVLATLHGGIPEAVENGRTGLLVAERDHEALFRAMIELTAGKRALEMGRAASAAVATNFEQVKQIENLEAFYDEAREIGKSGPKTTRHLDRSAQRELEGSRESSPKDTPRAPSTSLGVTGNATSTEISPQSTIRHPRSSFAYLFERFPSFTQTFCFREVEEMFRQKMAPAVYSIRPADEQSAFDPALVQHVSYLPEGDELTATIRAARAEHKIRSDVWEIFNQWGDRGDKMRLYEAAWLGLELKRRGIRHVHAHFAGIAARTAYWIKKFWGIGYSFTGHANDIFVETDFPVSLADLVREARFVVTETDFARDWMRGKFPKSARKFHRVYNGIHADKCLPAGIIEEGIPKITSVGRLVEKKGFATLIEACGRLREQNVSFYCRIVGTGPLENALREQIAQLDLGQHVALEGARSEDEVLRFLRGARVFALACAREADGGMDNLPTVIMEAMACGLPVISMRLAGVPEMVIAGQTGELVGEGDAAALAHAIGNLLNNRELARRLGERGREVALEKFATSATTRELKHLLAKHGRIRIPLPALRADPKLALKRLGLG